MKVNACALVSLTSTILLSLATPGQARWQVDLEGGVVASGYNDVRIPGSSGTRFSLSEELSTDRRAYVRARLTYGRGRHALSALVAPLSLHARGTLEDDLRFQDETFPARTALEVTYRFDSYRLTYRYEVVETRTTKVCVGATAKIRDAEVSVRAAERSASKTNLGFVPLLHGSLEWWFAARTSLVLVADALAAPQGRAEDVLVALRFEPVPPVAVRIGYRILEGGADTDEVYTFTLLHYLGLGVSLSL